MAVTPEYLARIRRAVRQETDNDVDEELTDLIEECRLDLISSKVLAIKVEDESDKLILGAIRCFVRWKFGLSNDEAAGNRDDYMQLRDTLRNRRDYIAYSVTFNIASGGSPVCGAEITFNNETLITGAAGAVTFYYINAGNQFPYSVHAEGYVSQEDNIDVSASATVNISLSEV